MNDSGNPTPFLFVDDGHPESRDYDNNYVVLQPQPPRSWFDRLAACLPRRREPRPPGATRIVARPAAGTPAG